MKSGDMVVLIVDDNPINLVLMSALAASVANSTPATFLDPREALTWTETHTADLVLVDYHMPHLDGLEFIRRFTAEPKHADTPIVMVTTEADKAVRRRALVQGATDFLTKPVDTVEFRSRIRNLLELRHARNQLKARAEQLQRDVDEATAALVRGERELVLRLSKAAEYRDPETGAHILRMSQYAVLIARRLGMPDSFQQMLLVAAPMHDIGKLATPDHILLKAGRLDADELAIMRRHAEIGAEILRGSSSPLVQLAEEIAASHHEKYDGSGYPRGLAGASIPAAGRIVAVADVFDALTSSRPYKKAWSLEDARKFIIDNTGNHFCPVCSEAFLSGWDEVLLIRQRFPDDDESPEFAMIARAA
jgi:putative two-component system response regulator